MTDSLFSVNVPLSGALNVGAQFGQSAKAGSATGTNNVTYNGNLLVANYTLSKRTYLVANYYSYQAGGTENASGYGLFLYNCF